MDTKESSLIGKQCLVNDTRYEIVSGPQFAEGFWWVCCYDENTSKIRMVYIEYIEVI